MGHSLRTCSLLVVVQTNTSSATLLCWKCCAIYISVYVGRNFHNYIYDVSWLLFMVNVFILVVVVSIRVVVVLLQVVVVLVHVVVVFILVVDIYTCRGCIYFVR